MEEEDDVQFVERLKKMKEEGLRRRENKKMAAKAELKKIREERKQKNLNEMDREKLKVQELRKKLQGELEKVQKERRFLEKEREKLNQMSQKDNTNQSNVLKNQSTIETSIMPTVSKSIQNPDSNSSLNATKKKKKSKKSRRNCVLNSKEIEEKRKKTRERVRAYRERIRSDPEKHLQNRLNEKLRSSNRRKEGKIKSISKMTKREARIQRKIWREKKQKERRLKKQILVSTIDSPPPSPSSPDPPIALTPNSSDNKKNSGKKRLRKNRDAERKVILSLKKKNILIKRDVEKWKKRFYREKNKQLSPSPRKMVREVMKKGNKEVRRQLHFSYAISKQLRKGSVDCKSKNEKKLLSKCVSGDVIKKNHMMKEVKNLGISSIYLQRKYGVNKTSLNQEMRIGRIKKIKRKIADFFQDDEYSVQTPGKRQYITRKKEKKQKRLLLQSVKELHKIFVKKNKINISYTSFNKYKPFWVVAPKESDRDSCKCIKHANFELMLKALARNNVIKLKCVNKVLESVNCNVNSFECMYSKCNKCDSKKLKQADLEMFNAQDEITFFEWTRKRVEIQNKVSKCQNLKEEDKTKKTKTVTIVQKEKKKCKVEELLNKFNDYLKAFCVHVYNASHQRNYFREYKKGLKANEMLIVLDWSENYCCRYSQEIQSMHFGGSRQQISLHTGVMYYEQKEVRSFCTISSDRYHGPAAIWAHMKPILEFIKENYNSVDTLHFFSDGPTVQYRNKENMFLMAKTASELDMWKVCWNFSEAGHGKGPADAIGGIVKRTADSVLLHQNDVIDVKSFKNAISTLRVLSFIIDESEIVKMRKLLPMKLDPVPNTMKLHQLVWIRSSPQILGTRILSCTHCSGSLKCKHYPLGFGEFKLASSVTNTSSLDLAIAGPSNEQEPRNIQDDHNIDSNRSCNVNTFNNLAVNSWVAAIYDQIWYPGVIEKKEDNVLTVKFMHRSKSFFQWPTVEDRQTLEVDGVLCSLKAPIKISSRLYKFEDSGKVDEQCSFYVD